ncbi:MAG: deoxyguanosinetriphosphate triphosphohydrolase [Proteobacteria bacterium]|nr:deoxyguanosinetriphosphate triphosphohydrolase [Pseudomonadota bacterium]MCL2308160.1 deoxyguanosinetriphosphate triphosphohydrolase [Pseudomonadota bacterium]
METLTPNEDSTALAERWRRFLSPRRIGATEHVAPAPDRSVFQQDYDRIVFCSAFRRLKDKTQVFPLAQSDYVRNRLTHSLEASCVGRSLGTTVGRVLVARHRLEDVLHASDFGAVVAAACLAHDIGNPPFGHAGEDAIREWCAQPNGALDRLQLTGAQRADFARYEGNAQGFRVLTALQSPSNPGGLQLTAATLMAFAKYPCASKTEAPLDGRSTKKFGYFQSEAALFHEAATAVGMVARTAEAWRRHPLAFLVEAADDICYRIVDLEDAARIGVVPAKDVEALLLTVAGGETRATRLNNIVEPKERIEYLRAKAIGRLVEEVAEIFLSHETAIVNGDYDEELLSESKVAATLEHIEKLSHEKIYIARSAMEIEAAGCEVLSGLLDLFFTAVSERFNAPTRESAPIRSRVLIPLLPPQFLGDGNAPDADPYLRLLKIVDFVCGMTDSYAITLYRRLKGIELPG